MIRLPRLGSCAGTALLLLIGCDSNSDSGNSATEASEAPVAEAPTDELDAALDAVDIPTQAELDEAAANSIDASNEEAEFDALWNEVMNDDG